MTNKNKLKLAFIGGGINSAVGSAHYSAICLENNFELVSGFFSRNKDINFESAQKYNVCKERVYSNIEELIKKKKEIIDAVIILTPTNQHASHVLNFLNNNIPVICEKSLTASVEEIIDIENALKRENGFLSVIYNYLGYPMIRELKHIIRLGKLGKIIHIQIEMPQEGFIRINKDSKPIIPQKWRLQDNSVPTISLDLGVHLHMLIKYLTNEEPINVVAKSESLGNFSAVIDNINCLIEYSNNITCNMWYSKIASGYRNGLKIRIFGQDGSAEWIQEDPEILQISDSNGRRWKVDRGNADVEICNEQRYTRFKVGHPAGFIEAFANYYNDIAASLQNFIKTGKMDLIECFGISESYEGIRLLDAINKSGISRSWEKV